MAGIKDYLGYRNEKKRVITKLAGGKSIVEVFDGISSNNEAKFRYAIALTDANGTAVTDLGVILTAEELKGLANAINKALENGDIQPTRTRAEYKAIYPEKESPRKPLFC